MSRARAVLPCPACEGTLTRIIEQDPDPDHSTVLRMRACLDCHELIGSHEQLIPAAEVRRRLDELARERMGDLRAVRKALAPPLRLA